jgi:hypothetical protein
MVPRRGVFVVGREAVVLEGREMGGSSWVGVRLDKGYGVGREVHGRMMRSERSVLTVKFGWVRKQRLIGTFLGCVNRYAFPP